MVTQSAECTGRHTGMTATDGSSRVTLTVTVMSLTSLNNQLNIQFRLQAEAGWRPCNSRSEINSRIWNYWPDAHYISLSNNIKGIHQAKRVSE
jgi:hypothetical protein